MVKTAGRSWGISRVVELEVLTSRSNLTQNFRSLKVKKSNNNSEQHRDDLTGKRAFTDISQLI